MNFKAKLQKAFDNTKLKEEPIKNSKESRETYKERLNRKLARAAYIGARFVINDQLVEGIFAYYPYFVSAAKGARYLGKRMSEIDAYQSDSELEELIDEHEIEG